VGGHSHWAGIKHKKAIVDAKRGKVWTKIVKEIAIAARIGGGDINSNPRLRSAVEDARASNMPADNVKRAIQRGTGEIPGMMYEERVYEGYGPNGVAMIVEVTTDNHNRTLNEVRQIFREHGGNLGESNCVAWMFKPKGFISVAKPAPVDEDTLISHALDLGAEDVVTDVADAYEIYTEPKDLEPVKAGLAARKIPVAAAEVFLKPDTTVPVGKVEPAAQILKLVEALEDNDDVKKVHANFDIPDDILDQVG
jgi:YebC/PmpR family DNA-binding regulatory protein